MTTPIFNFEKTINAALYIAERVESKDFHKIFKILYFADREHLSKYGRPITGDTYIKMKAGPVPSQLFDILKKIRDDSFSSAGNLIDFFSVHDNHFVTPKKSVDLRCLSKTDIMELDKSISEYGKYSFEKLSKISHGLAWESATENSKMYIENIMKEAGDNDEFIALISDSFQTQRIFCQ
jgi:uncharacterized phage-associated protein